jgi:hypothetical protein
VRSELCGLRQPLLPGIDAEAPGEAPPAQAHSATSVEAAEKVKGCTGRLRRAVLELLRGLADGATDEEMQAALGMAQNTQRPRRVELVRQGLVKDSGRTRLTASRRRAVVWVAA